MAKVHMLVYACVVFALSAASHAHNVFVSHAQREFTEHAPLFSLADTVLPLSPTKIPVESPSPITSSDVPPMPSPAPSETPAPQTTSVQARTTRVSSTTTPVPLATTSPNTPVETEAGVFGGPPAPESTTPAPLAPVPTTPAPPTPVPSLDTPPVPVGTPALIGNEELPTEVPLLSPEPSTSDSSSSSDDSSKDFGTSDSSVNVAIENTENQDSVQMKDVIVFDASSKPTTKDPLAIPVINVETQEPKILDFDQNESSESPKKFVRGQIEEENNDEAVIEDENESNKEEEPNVIGGRNRVYAPIESAESKLTETSENIFDFITNASCMVAGISVALLLFFHYVSLDDISQSSGTSLWNPNTWEFLVYVGFLQQMASVSQLSLSKAPSYLLEFTDSFSWITFVLHGSSIKDGNRNRRLETIVLEGVVAYADRIDIPESKIFYHCLIGFLIVIGIMLMIFFMFTLFAKYQAEQGARNFHVLTASFGRKIQKLRCTSIRTLGLCVLIWFFALYPLALFSSYEISMSMQASASSINILTSICVAMIALVILCFGILALSGIIIMHKSWEELQQNENIATLGSLYAEYIYSRRMFFVVVCLVQLLTGIFIGAINRNPTQLILVVVVQVIFLVNVFLFSPFSNSFVFKFTVALTVVKMINFGFAFAFFNSQANTTFKVNLRGKIAQTYILFNSFVILLWFVRFLVIFSTYIRIWLAKNRTLEENYKEHHSQRGTSSTCADTKRNVMSIMDSSPAEFFTKEPRCHRDSFHTINFETIKY